MLKGRDKRGMPEGPSSQDWCSKAVCFGRMLGSEDAPWLVDVISRDASP